MSLKEATTGHLAEILDRRELIEPNRPKVTGRYHVGEEPPEAFPKARLIFPSGELLPRCSCDPRYGQPPNRRRRSGTRLARILVVGLRT